MKSIKRWIAVLLLFSTMLTGCRIGNKNIVVLKPLSNRYVFRIGEFSCDIKEAKLYLANYQNLYGEAYTLDLWQHDFGEESLEEYVKSITLNELVSVACMMQLAKERGISLLETDEVTIKKAASIYYESLTNEERRYLGINESEILEYYRHYALAQKVYESIMSGIDGEVSDDEARVMNVMQIYVTDGAKATEVAKRLANGEDFATVANAYNELSSIQATIRRLDLPKEAEELIFELDDNEISGKIETESGYYFIKCLSKYNPELTEQNKLKILERRRKEALSNVYNEFISTLSSMMNEGVWASIEINPTLEIETDSFFEVYQSCCKEE